MRETYDKHDCGRAAQLVGYLYGESHAAERADFERHLHDCAACRDEMAAFTHVRGSVSDFRDELLRTAPAVSLAEFATNASAKPTAEQAPHAPHVSSRDESESNEKVGFASPVAGSRASAGAAWAALREFFRVSPAWLRASTVAAALALCALALLAVANAEVSFGDRRYALRTGTRPAAASPASVPAPSQQSEDLAALQAQLKSVASERDAAVRELEETRGQLDDSRAASLVAAEFETEADARRAPPPSLDESRRRRAPAAASKPERPSRTTRRRAEEEELPRLLDLLGDAN